MFHTESWIAMTITDVFEAMPAQLNSAAAKGIDKTLQWIITGDEPGVWALHIADGVAHLIPGGVEKPDAIITVTSQDWIALVEGKLNPMQAFLTGKVKVTGDNGLVMQILRLFPQPK